MAVVVSCYFGWVASPQNLVSLSALSAQNLDLVVIVVAGTGVT